MRYGGLLKRVMEGRFVMLLVDFEGCRIGAKCGEGGGVAEGVAISYFAVRRGRREGVEGDFGREAISVQDIGFFGVEAGVVGEVVGEVGGVGNVGIATGV